MSRTPAHTGARVQGPTQYHTLRVEAGGYLPGARTATIKRARVVTGLPGTDRAPRWLIGAGVEAVVGDVRRLEDAGASSLCLHLEGLRWSPEMDGMVWQPLAGVHLHRGADAPGGRLGSLQAATVYAQTTDADPYPLAAMREICDVLERAGLSVTNCGPEAP